MSFRDNYAPPKVVNQFMPTVVDEKTWQLMTLETLYIVGFLHSIAVIFICKKYDSKFRFLSLKFLLLLIGLIIMFFRSITHLFPIKWSFYWLIFCGVLFPMLLQCTIFALCTLKLLKRLYTLEAKDNIVFKIFYPFFTVSILLVWIASLIVCYFISRNYSFSEFRSQISIFSTFLFGFLSSILGIISFITFRDLKTHNLPSTSGLQLFMIIVTSYYLAAIARSIWNLTNFFGINIIDEKHALYNYESDPRAFTIFLFFRLAFEIIPIYIHTFLSSIIKEDDGLGFNVQSHELGLE